MNSHHYPARLLSLLIMLLGELLSSAALAGEQQKLVVYSVNYPLAYFAERIGGDHVEVSFLQRFIGFNGHNLDKSVVCLN